ncbi:ketoacyl-synthetase C-terminal extension domain-containing protein, partial [Streptomyces sp. ISL-11]|uniref:ketoacyl-synthetase C-terminal extension domain-containing protein n=1 Tax=Streptomyces sp. ISL-11 TaxID=2819174 RepID=UPI001BE8FC88
MSSFGFSGTNAHTIIEEAPEPEPVAGEPAEARRTPAVRSLPAPVVLSAKTPQALRAQAGRLLRHTGSQPGTVP